MDFLIETSISVNFFLKHPPLLLSSLWPVCVTDVLLVMVCTRCLSGDFIRTGLQYSVLCMPARESAASAGHF